MWMPDSKNKCLPFEIPSPMGKPNKKIIAVQGPRSVSMGDWFQDSCSTKSTDDQVPYLKWPSIWL